MQQRAVMAGDGSHDPILKRSTGSWTISSPDGTLRAHCSCPCDGDPKSLNSYRAELEAIRCLLYWLRLLFRIHDVPLSTDLVLRLWIDNTQALKKASMDDVFKPTQCLGPESDLVLEILDLRDIIWGLFSALNAVRM